MQLCNVACIYWETVKVSYVPVTLTCMAIAIGLLIQLVQLTVITHVAHVDIRVEWYLYLSSLQPPLLAHCQDS